jgi:hypothetical protein
MLACGKTGRAREEVPALRTAVWKEDRRPEGRGIVARSAMPWLQIDPCVGTPFGLRQGRAALLPLSRSGHGLIPVTYGFSAAMHASRTR